MPRDTCLRHRVSDIHPSLPVPLPLPGCYYQVPCILTFCVSANRCSNIKPHLFDNILSFLCCLGLFGLQPPKTDLNCLACLWLQSALLTELHVCVCKPSPEVIFLLPCLQQPGTSAQTVFDRGITCVLCKNIQHERCSLCWNLHRKTLPRALTGELRLICSKCKRTNKLFPFPKTLFRICTISKLARRRSLAKPWGKVLTGVVKCQKDFSVGKTKVMF